MTTTVHRAIVKSIVSGDTLVVKPSSSSVIKTKHEQRISLNYIIAPKLARPSTSTKKSASNDEPYAFECREYLRRKLIEQEISYTIDIQIPQTNRLICTVYLGSENLIESLVAEGLVQLQSQIDKHMNITQYERLVSIDEQAKINKRGRYSDDLLNNHIRNIKWNLDNPNEFIEMYKDEQPLDAIVEFIRDGNTLRCLFLPFYYLVTIQITGIKCPMLKHEENSSNEPFAEEAKEYVKTRLLQRDVKLLLNGVNNQNLVATVLHSNKNLALYLLKQGLAKCVDWSLTLLDVKSREEYRTIEKFAKDNRLGIWQNYIPQSTVIDNLNDPSVKQYQAKVLEIINGDALIIRDIRDNSIRKIYLSSVRAPRIVDNSKRIIRALYDIPFLFDAHEFLRQCLIGKTVYVINDYTQPSNNNYPEKVFSTVYINNVNISEALISRGLAKATRHRSDDEQRSSRYDDLLIAEKRAEKRGIGLFSKDTGLYQIVDITGEVNKERAKSLLNVLLHKSRMEGVIESIINGSHFRIHLLKDNWIISLILSSIQCPRAEKQNIEPENLFGNEALSFSKEHFLQRNVFVDVQNIDCRGNFIGYLTTVDEQSIALMLVQAGLAKVHQSIYNAPNYKELLAVEDKCCKEGIGIWKNAQPTSKTDNAEEIIPQDENIHESEIITYGEQCFRPGVISYMTSELKMYVQYSEQKHQLEELQNTLHELFDQNASSNGYKPKKGELIAARCSYDNQWYRARVEKYEKNNRIHVFFIDYGNREIITDLTRIEPLPSDFAQLPSQAHEYELAYVQIPSNGEDRQRIVNTLVGELGTNECLIKVEYRQNNTEFISIYSPNTNENILKTLVEQGLITSMSNHNDQLQR